MRINQAAQIIGSLGGRPSKHIRQSIGGGYYSVTFDSLTITFDALSITFDHE